MLEPADRRLLFDVLAPPEGYTFDHAIGTTYTLDLLALLRVPLAATTLPWADANGGSVSNPFALLTALRRNASKISLFCHAGATKVPAGQLSLLTFLEDSVHPVTPPNEGSVFHPKIWLLRFDPVDPDDQVRYRLVVLSRNLTFDRCWDVALTLEGVLRDDRVKGFSENAPLAAFVAALPGMAEAAGSDLPDPAQARVDLMADELRRVAWYELPDGFDGLAFHPIGHDGRPNWPIQDLRELLVVSPFVTAPALDELRERARGNLSLIGRYEELARLGADDLSGLDEVDIFDDAATLLEVEAHEDNQITESQEASELSGLHAKLFVGTRGKAAVVYVGSANATDAAFTRNVEFLVELTGSRAQHGIDKFRETLRDARMLRPFVAGAQPEIDEESESLQRALEHAAHGLAAGGLRARVDPIGDEWRTTLVAAKPIDLGELHLEARPLTNQMLRPVKLGADPACTFPPTELASITSFFALRLRGRAGGVDQHIDVTVRLPLEGAPEGRAEAVTADLLSDRERLLKFILLLLSEGGDVDRLLDHLGEPPSEPGRGGTGAGGGAEPGLPLLEPMLRALHSAPERLEEIGQLLEDLRTAGGATNELLPDELQDLWETVWAVRGGKA